MKKSIILLLSIGAGTLIPWAGEYSFLVTPLLFGMLFCAFLEMRSPREMLQEKRLFMILGANIIIGVIAFFFFAPLDSQVAKIAFLIGAMPTATAAPAVTSYLRGNVDFVIAAVFLSNAIMAILWPIFFWLLFSLHIPFWHLLLSTSSIVIGPLVAARAFRLMFPQTTSSDAILQKVRSVSFLLWLGVVFLASAKASAFLRTGNDSLASILAVACLAGAFCAFQFWLGKKIGGKEFGLEVSQSLGQKNTIFALWACLQFFSPFIALGPIFYLLFHNLYNSYLLATAGREVKIPEKSP